MMPSLPYRVLRPGSPLVLVLLAILIAAPSANAVTRTGTAPPVKSGQGTSLVFTTVKDPLVLIQCLLGATIQTRNEVLAGADSSGGTFVGGTGIIGFESGIALSTGLVTSAIGPNEGTDFGTDHKVPGDPDLDALLDPEVTYDPVSLQFEFFTAQPRTVEFQYVFASEEYSEFVGEGYDDVVAFFLNGVAPANNIARVPAGCGTIADVPVSVDNVNCGNIFEPTEPETNCACYIDNEIPAVFPPPPPPLNTEMDGMTHVFTATGTTIAGWNTLKIAVADAGDGILDSNVFIKCSSFIVPARPATWGQIKANYR